MATADDDDFDDFDGEDEDGFVDYGPANDGGGGGDAPGGDRGDAPGGDGFNDGSGNDHGFNIDDAHEPHVMSGLRFLVGACWRRRGARAMTMGSGGFAVRPYTSTAEMHATRASFQTQTRRAMNPGPGLHMRRRLGRIYLAPDHPETCVMTGKSPKKVRICGAGLGDGSPVRTTRRGRPRPPSHRLGDTARLDPNPHSPGIPSRTPAVLRSKPRLVGR